MAASFRVVFRAPTKGRAQLFLTGKTAAKGGPLIDTKTSASEGSAGSFADRALVSAAAAARPGREPQRVIHGLAGRCRR